MEDKKPIAERLRIFAESPVTMELHSALGMPKGGAISTVMNFIADEIEAEQKELIERPTVQTHGERTELGAAFAAFADYYLNMPLKDGESIPEWLKRWFIPRPRFEDGEPVQFGDDIEIHNRSGLLDKGIIQSFHPNKGPVWMLSLVGCDHERLVRFDPETCVIKRPTHNVLDSDGVEINVGDIIYEIDGIKPLEVISICENGDIDAIGNSGLEAIGGNSLFFKLCSSSLTHEKPVLDKDGKRIKKGDVVWTKDGGSGKVASLHYEGETPVSGLSPATIPFVRYEDRCWNYANEVTHSEPDSIQKVINDIRDYIDDDASISPNDAEEIINRLALIEMGA